MKIPLLLGLALVFVAGFILASDAIQPRFSPNAAVTGSFFHEPVCPLSPYTEDWSCQAETFPDGPDFTQASFDAYETCKRGCFSHTQNFVDACNDYCNVGHATWTQGGQTLHCAIGSMTSQQNPAFCVPTCFFDTTLQQYVCQSQGQIQFICQCVAT